MTPLGIITLVISIIIAFVLGSFLYKKFPNLFGTDRRIEKIIKDPHLLVEKLNSQGKFYDDGKELEIKVGIDSKTGKEVVVVEEKKSKKAEKIQKKVNKADLTLIKPKIKPKTKKKVVKKGVKKR